VYSACYQAEPASHGVARSFGVDVRFVLAPTLVECLPLVLHRCRLDLRVLARNGCLAVFTASANSHGLTLSYRVLQTPSRRPSLTVAASSCGSFQAAPPMRFFAPSAFPRSRKQLDDAVCLAASHAPSGFLNLPTLCSSTCLLALFRARSAHGVVPFRAFSPHTAVRRLRRRAPPDVWCAP
jgi:hypothetical protein